MNYFIATVASCYMFIPCFAWNKSSPVSLAMFIDTLGIPSAQFVMMHGVVNEQNIISVKAQLFIILSSKVHQTANIHCISIEALHTVVFYRN